MNKLTKILLSCLLVALLVGGIVYFLQPKDPSDRPTGDVTTGGQSTKGETDTPAQTDKPSPNPPPSQPGNAKTGTDAPDTNAPLQAPDGQFIGNHKPNLGGSPAPNVIQSVCNTTSGASCQIIFTKDGVIKSLPAQTADRGGAVYWTWKLQDVGLTEGFWKVQAKATLGSQTKTTDDAMDLEVRP